MKFTALRSFYRNARDLSTLFDLGDCRSTRSYDNNVNIDTATQRGTRYKIDTHVIRWSDGMKCSRMDVNFARKETTYRQLRVSECPIATAKAALWPYASFAMKKISMIYSSWSLTDLKTRDRFWVFLKLSQQSSRDWSYDFSSPIKPYVPETVGIRIPWLYHLKLHELWSPSKVSVVVLEENTRNPVEMLKAVLSLQAFLHPYSSSKMILLHFATAAPASLLHKAQVCAASEVFRNCGTSRSHNLPQLVTVSSNVMSHFCLQSCLAW